MFSFLLGAVVGSIVTVAVPRVASASAKAYAAVKEHVSSLKS